MANTIPETLTKWGARNAYHNLKYGAVMTMGLGNDKVVGYGGTPAGWYTADLVPGGFSGKTRANFVDITEVKAIELIKKAWEDN